MADLDGIRALWTPGAVHELRALDAGRYGRDTEYGYFNSPDALAEAADKLGERSPAIYMTVNPVAPELLARANNRVKIAGKGNTTGDDHIAARRLLFIDLDPDRLAGIPATDEEHELARLKANEIVAALVNDGWPAPAVADSGNGYYLLYGIDLPNNPDSLDLVGRCLAALGRRFDSDRVHVDQTGKNAARIMRVPGTVNRKGDGTPDRPHRTARMLTTEPPAVVDIGLLEALAGSKTAPAAKPAGPREVAAPGPGEYDINRVLSKLDIITGPDPYKGGQIWVVVCPFNPDHTDDSAYVGHYASGALFAGCHHNSCKDKWEWADLRAKVDPKPAKKTAKKPAKTGSGPSPMESAASAAPATEPTVLLEDGTVVLDRVHAWLARFVAYPSGAAHVAHTLWAAHAHAMDAWESTPRIAFLSPEPGSGKSRALEVTEPLVPNPVEAVNVTPAYLFRKVGNEAPTVLFDEIDTVFGPKAKNNEELRGLLNAGHRRGAVAGRCVTRGEVVETEEIPAYCAVAVAGLGALPDTILTRSVVVRMRRRSPDEVVEPYRRRVHGPEGMTIRSSLMRWVTSVAPVLRDAWPKMPEGVADRNADVWEALLAIADAAGGEWPDRARAAAVALVAESMGDAPSLGVRLLADLRTVFAEQTEMAGADILTALRGMDEAPWDELRGAPLNARGLANLLRPYGVRSTNIRKDDRVVKGYKRESLWDAWSRYLPDGCNTRNTRNAPGRGVAPVAPVAGTGRVQQEERDCVRGACPQADICEIVERCALTPPPARP
ncbi:MAG TPA: DUF3631 domain-containing protein [Micromonosporaceae bacterium]|jgi:hypothetical protein